MDDPAVRSAEWSATMWPIAKRLHTNSIKNILAQNNPNLAFELCLWDQGVQRTVEAPEWPWWLNAKDQEPYRFLNHLSCAAPVPDDWDDKALAEELLDTIDRYIDIQLDREEEEWEREQEEKKKKDHSINGAPESGSRVP